MVTHYIRYIDEHGKEQTHSIEGVGPAVKEEVKQLELLGYRVASVDPAIRD